MRIGLEGNQEVNIQKKASSTGKSQQTNIMPKIKADILQVSMDISKVLYGKIDKGNEINTNGKKVSSKEGLFLDERNTDYLKDIKNALDSLANQMTGKDYNALMEEGYSFDETEVKELVTVVEKIKIKLAAYSDDYNLASQVDLDKIKDVVGSAGMAYSIANKLNNNNIQVNEESISDVMETYEIYETLEPVSKDQAGFLVKNNLEPTIENIYKAQHSGTFYKKAPSKISEQEWDELKPQVEKILSQSGLVIDTNTMEDAKWILEQGLPLEIETIKELENIVKIELSNEAEVVIDNIVNAIAKGKNPRSTLLTGEEYSLKRVSNALQVIEDKVEMAYHPTDESIEAVTARRQLEEIRLRMTKEAGLSLLKKGIEIETSPLEELVEELKTIEAKYYKQLYELEGLEPSQEHLSLVKETVDKIGFLKEAPNYLLVELPWKEFSPTIEQAYQIGKKLQLKLDTVGESYEALMTKPNYEYGDRIAKAFQNIDRILENLNLETSKENQRAVKILAYNQMDITEESVLQIKKADQSFQSLLKGMTPRVTLHIVENGVNPLNTPIDTLNQEIEKILDKIGPTKEEKYSEFLWNLEHSEGINAEERAAYIDLYRILNTVEKTQGAAIGALINQGSEINLKNLLTAAKTRSAKSINIAVDSKFGFLEDSSYSGYKITQLKEMSGQEEALRMLTEENLPVTLNHLLTANIMANQKGSIFSKLQERAESDHVNNVLKESESLLEALTDSESMENTYQKLADDAGKLLKEAYESNQSKYLDLESLKRIHTGFRLMTRMSKNESYQVPLNIQGEVTTVNLKIVRGRKDTGKVAIELNLEEIGKVLAEFRVKGNTASGFINLESVKAVESIKEKLSDFSLSLEQSEITVKTLDFHIVKEIKRFSTIEEKDNEVNEETESIKTKTLYGIAKAFISSLKENGGIHNED